MEWMACKKAVVLCRFVPDVRNLPLSAPHVVPTLFINASVLRRTQGGGRSSQGRRSNPIFRESRGEDIGFGAIVFVDRRDLDGSLQIVTQCVTNAPTVDVKTTDPHRSTGSTDQSIG